MASPVGWYLHAFLYHTDLPPMKGIDGHSPLSLTAEQGIAALSSPVPLTEFGEEALRKNLNDLRWLEEKVRLHEAILEAVMAKGPLLPMKFGTILLDQERIREVIRRNSPTLQAALEDLREKAEWGVKGFADREALQAAALRSDPELLAASKDAWGKPLGQAFFLRRKIEESASQKAQERGEALVHEAYEAIRGWAEELVDIPIIPPEPMQGIRTVLNLACLIRRERVAAFLAGVGRWTRGHTKKGVWIAATGPWPPYHFVPRIEDVPTIDDAKELPVGL